MAKLKKTNKKLSEYPSVAIMQVVDDIKAVLASDDYEFAASEWYSLGTNTCFVCAAGAVAARRYDALPSPIAGIALKGVALYGLEHQQVESFDNLRKGNYRSFLYYWIDDSTDIEILAQVLNDLNYFDLDDRNLHLDSYDNPLAIIAHFEKVAKYLETQGY